LKIRFSFALYPARHAKSKITLKTLKTIATAQILFYLRSSSGRPAQIRGRLRAFMKIAAAIAVLAGSLAPSSVMAADMALKTPGSAASCDPYANYSCLNAYLGDDFVSRLYRYYALEWGHDGPPTDPKAPPSRRSEAAWPATPESTPPMPFTEWPYGGTTPIGVTRPGSVDSPLMVALSNTQLGAALNASQPAGGVRLYA
jgi:hypothetical protein